MFFKVEFNKSKNLLRFFFSQHVTPDETSRWREQLKHLLADVQPDFKLLSDLSGLESMAPACAVDIEFGMDLLDKAGIAKVVRIFTDPRKDIGLSIMSVFHYRRGIPIVTSPSSEER